MDICIGRTKGLNMATKYIMTKEVILERVKQIIENQLLLEDNTITKNTTLLKSSGGDSLDVDSLDVDSLDLVELILTFEEAFKIDISDEDASNLLVVGDIVNYVALALEKKEEESGKRKKLPGELAQELNLVDPLIDD